MSAPSGASPHVGTSPSNSPTTTPAPSASASTAASDLRLSSPSIYKGPTLHPAKCGAYIIYIRRTSSLRRNDALSERIHRAEIKGHWKHAQCLVRKFDCIHNSIFFGLKNLFLPCFKYERPRKHSFQPFSF